MSNGSETIMYPLYTHSFNQTESINNSILNLNTKTTIPSYKTGLGLSLLFYFVTTHTLCSSRQIVLESTQDVPNYYSTSLRTVRIQCLSCINYLVCMRACTSSMLYRKVISVTGYGQGLDLRGKHYFWS
jgi:hypothetical protein